VQFIALATSTLIGFHTLPTEVGSDLADLFEGSFEVIDDFLPEHIGIRKIIGFFEAFVPEPEDVEAGLVVVRSELEESECPLFSSFSRSIVCLKSQDRT